MAHAARKPLAYPFPIAWLKRQPAAVKVVEVQGKAEAVLAATGQTLPVSAGRLLCSGDEVRTGPDGSVSLEFGDGSKLLLQADSRLVMDSLSAYGESGMVDTRVCLQQGRATSRVTPRRGLGRPRYEISTPAAVSAVRSTQYRVSAEVERQHRRLFCVPRAVMRCRGITLAGPCGPTTWAFCYRGSAYRVWTSPRRSRDPAGPGAMRCC